MDSNGMLPAHNCKQCGNTLNADGGHPAELYAGTYTGLCHKCERSGERLIKTARLDGAQTWEFPPHCPSWRRDRERFIGFAGCSQCEGKGRLWAGRADSQGGSYSQQCPVCSMRYWNHPLRLWEAHRYGSVRKAAESLYHKELRKRKLLGKAKAGTIPAELCQEIQLPFNVRMEQAQARFKTIADRRLQRI
jgi:hypothetical protein